LPRSSLFDPSFHASRPVPGTPFLQAVADLPSGWVRLFRRIDQSHDALEDIDDGDVMGVQPGFDFTFQGGQLAYQFVRACQRGAHPNEGPHNKDTHLGCPIAVENTRRHDGAVFREDKGQRFPVLALL
jgi:hypothetical protein